MLRKIIEINEDKCNGCGICVNACHEGAIELINGKARLVSDIYCDGLGDCLPGCPVGAIEIIERESLEYDDAAVKERMKEKEPLPCGCPGTAAKAINRNTILKPKIEIKVQASDLLAGDVHENKSQLNQWPVQLKLVNSRADYLKGADILIAADCTAFAYGRFHEDFIKGRITLIACPKLDDNGFNKEKIEEILRINDIKSITVVRMEVPCCGGIVQAVKAAMLGAQKIVQYNEIIIGVNGEIKK